MDYNKLEDMAGVDEEESMEAEDDGTEGMDPELKMLAKEAGFEGPKAAALKAFVELCSKSNYEE